MNIVGKRNLYFLISLIVLIPGIISLALFGLKLSVDFTGGSVSEYSFNTGISSDAVAKVFEKASVPVESIQTVGKNTLSIRTKAITNQKNDEIKKEILKLNPKSVQSSFDTVGPSIGAETTRNALLSLTLASIGILLFIAYSFRQIPSPYSSFKFGVSAIVALLHDAFVVLGIFSLLGHFAGIEINALFITAVLTVIGFSVHDTIVVFDRIRENLTKLRGQNFESIVNFSLVETLNRSLKTSLTVLFTLLALLLLGGETVRYFVLALLVGIISGTYSSVFNAAPILVVWENWSSKKKK